MSSVRVIIKAPNQKIDDQTIDCSLDWDVLKLKCHLSNVYPTKPRVDDQRLIFSGHMLKNEQILIDVLQPTDDNNSTFTVHLVCAHQSQDSPRRPKSMASTNNSERRSSTHNAFQTDAARSSASGTGASSSITPNFIPPLQYGFVQPPSGAMVMTPDQMFQQMALMQQAYVQYMNQYFGQTLANAVPMTQPNIIPPNVTMGQFQPPIVTNIPPPQVPQEAVPPQPQQPQPQQVQRMNAGPGGGVDDDDEMNNRDWLDWVYWMSRAIVLFSIVYFYSSFGRFIFVIGLAVMLYIYQNHWNYRRIAQRQNINRAAPPVAYDNNNRNNEQIDDNVLNDEENENAGDAGADVTHQNINANNNSIPQPTEERFTGLRLFWVIVSSLFTSLIPEQPAPVNLN